MACSTPPRQVLVNIVVMWCVLNVGGDLLRKYSGSRLGMRHRANHSPVFILPTAMVRKMSMSTGQKIGISIVFALVFVIIVVDILRTIFTLKMGEFPEENTIWALLEPTIAVILCALPCYRGLVARGASVRSFLSFFSRSLSNISSRSGSSEDNTSQSVLTAAK